MSRFFYLANLGPSGIVQKLDSNAVLAEYPLPTSVTHTSELTPVYEDILPPEKQKSKKMFHMHQHLSSNNCHFKY